MGIAGVGANPYNYYGRQYSKNSHVKQSGTTNTANAAVSNYTIHGDSKEYGKVLGGIGFPDGSNSAVYKSKNYTTDNPVFLVMVWDAEGNKTETEIDASKVNPANASLQEMLALNANRQLNNEESFGNELMMAAGRLHGDETASGYGDFFSKNNWITELEDFMSMQYMLGNLEGYLQYKKASEMLQSISDKIMSLGNSSDKTDSKKDYSKLLEQYAEKAREKIKNGDPAYQIGGQSYTEKEWKRLLEKIDKDIERTEEQIQELLKDNRERSFEAYGPNAPEEVKKAWLEAAEETGITGPGMNADGKMSHITQLDVQRFTKWILEGSTDVLGTTIKSARQAIEQALYDLENPLGPVTNKSADVRKGIEKEKEFYQALLEKLS